MTAQGGSPGWLSTMFWTLYSSGALMQSSVSWMLPKTLSFYHNQYALHMVWTASRTSTMRGSTRIYETPVRKVLLLRMRVHHDPLAVVRHGLGEPVQGAGEQRSQGLLNE